MMLRIPIKCKNVENRLYIWLFIFGALTGTIIPDQSEPGSNCCVAIRNEGMTLSFTKNIFLFISLERGQIICGVRETGGRKESNIDFHVNTQLLLLIIPGCIIFKALRLLFRRDVLNCSSLAGRLPLCDLGSLSADSTDHWHWQTATPTPTPIETLTWASAYIIS